MNSPVVKGEPWGAALEPAGVAVRLDAAALTSAVEAEPEGRRLVEGTGPYEGLKVVPLPLGHQGNSKSGPEDRS